MGRPRSSNQHNLPPRLYERVNLRRVSWWCKSPEGKTMIVKSISASASDAERQQARAAAIYAFSRMKGWQRPGPEPAPTWATAYGRIDSTQQRNGMPQWAWRVFQRTKSKAVQRGIRWSLSAAGMARVAERAGGRCEVSGIPLMVSAAGLKGPYGPSLDRVDSAMGYAEQNVRIVCVAVNYALNSWGLDAFLPVAHAMAKRYQHPDLIPKIEPDSKDGKTGCNLATATR